MNLHEIFLAGQLMGGGSSDSDGENKFELIEEININENEIAIVKRTTEPNGTPYNFKKIVVMISVPISNVSSAGRVNINSEIAVGWRTDMISSDYATTTTLKAQIDGGLLDAYCLYSKAETERTAPDYRPDYMLRTIEAINSLAIFSDPLGTDFPVGTKMIISAVRK